MGGSGNKAATKLAEERQHDMATITMKQRVQRPDDPTLRPRKHSYMKLLLEIIILLQIILCFCIVPFLLKVSFWLKAMDYSQGF